MGRLALVPTPIGNLEDITLRALRLLRECDLVFAEDTRTSGNLLRHFSIQKPMRAFHIHNEHSALQKAIETIEQHQLCVLVSDAGTPGISDPGYLLIRECIRQGIELECLPGPNALIPALLVSGLPCDAFRFDGFLPHKKGRQTRIRELCSSKETVVLYESPHRLCKTLEQLQAEAGPERKVAVVREISKVHEQCLRGSLSELIAHFSQTAPKGEIVVVLEGMPD